LVGFERPLVRLYWDTAKWLWAAGGSVVTAVTQAIYAWWKGHPDSIALLIAFGEVTLFMAGAFVVSRLSKKHVPDSPKNGQRADRLGTDDQSIQPDLRAAPSIRIDYVSEHIDRLIFKNDRNIPAVVRRVGNLISKERYESEYELTLIPSTLPPVDATNPIECKLYNLSNPSIGKSSLDEALKGGTPQSLDSVVIDYDDCDGNEFSRRFILTRNADGTVAWIPDPVCLRGQTQSPVPGVQDLAKLRRNLSLAAAYPHEHEAAQQYARQLEEEIRNNTKQKAQFSERLATLKETASHLQLAGKLALLAEDASGLSEQFRMILANNTNAPLPIDLSHPFAGCVIGLSLSEDEEAIPWQRRNLICFKERYNVHRHYVKRLSLPNFDSGVLRYSIPNEDLEAKAIQEMLLTHSTALSDRAQQLITAYENASGS